MRKDIKIFMLYSGSGGNSVFVRVGESAILIDAGKSARALCSALCSIGEHISAIDAIFVTHEHSDHVSALEVLSKKNDIPIHITNISAKRFDSCPTAPIHARMDRHDIEFCVEVGELRVSSFRTPHDSKMSVGYRIEFCDGEAVRAIGLATDIGYVSEEIRENLLGCEAVIIEANHDKDMLMTVPYPYELKLRVDSKRGHLSNRECADFAVELAESGTKAFMLAHLSEENNTPELAFDEVNSAVVCYGASVTVARPDEVVEFAIAGDEVNGKREIYNPWNA